MVEAPTTFGCSEQYQQCYTTHTYTGMSLHRMECSDILCNEFHILHHIYCCAAFYAIVLSIAYIIAIICEASMPNKSNYAPPPYFS